MATYISFSELSVGDIVIDQFSGDSGVTFRAPGGTVISDAKSPFGNALQAARDGGAVEFPDWRIKGSFTTPNHSRIGVSVNQSVTISAKDKAGNLLGTMRVQSPKFTTDGSYFYGEFATGKANIAEFEISYTSQGPFAMASMTFDTTGIHHKPDFRFMLSNFDIPSRVGEKGFIEFIVARLYGSAGPINFSISSTPPGLFAASPVPTPFSGLDGTTKHVVLVAGSTGIRMDDVVTISGTPASATVGTSTRDINYFYSPPLHP